MRNFKDEINNFGEYQTPHNTDLKLPDFFLIGALKYPFHSYHLIDLYPPT
jgi:hypothetical protein